MTLDLLSYLTRTLIVGLVSVIVLALARRRSAATQHAIGASALVAMLVLVPASFVLNRQIKPIYKTPVVVISAPVRVIEPVQTAVSVASPVSAVSHNPFMVDPLGTFVTLWTVVALFLGARLLAGLGMVGHRVSRSKRIDLRPKLHTRVDAKAVVPLAVWWGGPVVLLPPTWNCWSEERLDTVLLHETAHLERGDCWIQFLASLTCVLAWPNPLAWWLVSKTRSLSEQAVDDLILASGVRADRYAQDLLDIAQQSRDHLAGLAMPMAVKPEVSRRIEMILNNRKQRGAVTMAAVLVMGLGYGGVALATSTWGFVPQSTVEKFKRALPAPIRQMVEQVQQQAVQQSALAPDVAPNTHAQLHVSPSLPEGLGLRPSSPRIVGTEEPVPQAVQPKLATAVPDLKSSGTLQLRCQLYTVDPKIDLSQFGTLGNYGDSETGLAVREVELPKFRTYLEQQRATAIGSDDLTLAIKKEVSPRFPNLPSSTKSKFQYIVSAKFGELLEVNLPVGTDSSASRFNTMFELGEPGTATVVITKSALSPGRNDLWILESLNRPLIQTNCKIDVYNVADSHHDPRRPDILARGVAEFRDFDLSSDQFGDFQKKLDALGASVTMRTWANADNVRPQTGLSGSWGAGKFSVDLNTDRILKLAVNPDVTADKPHYVSERPVVAGKYRVIVCPTDPGSELFHVFVVKMEVLDRDGKSLP